MNLQNCKIKKVYYTTKYNNQTIKVEVYGYNRKYQVNSRHSKWNE